MKKSYTQLSILALNVALATGCATQQLDQNTMPSLSISEPVVIDRASENPAPVSTVVKHSAEPKSQLAPAKESTIYFSYDSSELNDTAKGIVSSHIDYLKQHPDLVITIEGHADARGSEAYNIELGELRAQAIKSAMIAEHINPEKIRLISYGETLPAVEGSNDMAWRLNRRATIVYQADNVQLSSN